MHNFVGACKDFFQTFLEPVNIVIDKVLLWNVWLVDQAHESKTLVNLTEVKHDVLEFPPFHVGKADYRTWLLVKFCALAIFANAIDASYVDKYVY